MILSCRLGTSVLASSEVSQHSDPATQHVYNTSLTCCYPNTRILHRGKENSSSHPSGGRGKDRPTKLCPLEFGKLFVCREQAFNSLDVLLPVGIVRNDPGTRLFSGIPYFGPCQPTFLSGSLLLLQLPQLNDKQALFTFLQPQYLQPGPQGTGHVKLLLPS